LCLDDGLTGQNPDEAQELPWLCCPSVFANELKF